MSSPPAGSDGSHETPSAPDSADAVTSASSPAKESRRMRPGLWAVGGCLLLTVLLRGGLWPVSGSASTAEQGLFYAAGSGDSAATGTTRLSDASSHDTSLESSGTGAESAGKPPESSGDVSDAEYRRRIIGLWEQENHGHRTLDVHPDGTALMVVQPEPAWQILFGERLEFDVRWIIQSGRLETTVVAARPGATARAARQMYGDHHVSPIVVLDDSLMRLNDEEGEEHTPWHRSATAAQPGKSAE